MDIEQYKQEIQNEINRLEIQVERLRQEGHDDYSPEITMRQDFIERLKDEILISEIHPRQIIKC